MSRLVLIGYWCSDDEPEWPDPVTMVDTAWDETEREAVAAYLSSAFVPWVAAGHSTCRLCGQLNGSAEFSDGVYVWPEGLVHYVSDHSVRLPMEIVQHIKQRLDAFDFDNIDRESWKRMARPER